jgi:hypothetical protein
MVPVPAVVVRLLVSECDGRLRVLKQLAVSQQNVRTARAERASNTYPVKVMTIDVPFLELVRASARENSAIRKTAKSAGNSASRA